jgi:phosphoribosyl 1,2-cyclic phosphodiesterase
LTAIIGAGFDVTFHGVRGSTPCDGEEVARYGGNTSCVSLAIPDQDPMLFDLGTGLRYYGLDCPSDEPFLGSCLLSHLHWDHIQGLPFFTPLLRDGAHLDVYAPTQPDGRPLGDVFGACLCPPTFPISIDAFPGTIHFHGVGDDSFKIGDVDVMSRVIPHVGTTCGYRVTWGGASVAYLSDHQQPGVDVFEMSEGARDLCQGADLLIHDAQYTAEEFRAKSTWGHCTVDYAVWLAAECGVKTLALYHHDPTHGDDVVDQFVDKANAHCGGSGLEIIGAREGLTVRVGAPS